MTRSASPSPRAHIITASRDSRRPELQPRRRRGRRRRADHPEVDVEELKPKAPGSLPAPPSRNRRFSSAREYRSPGERRRRTRRRRRSRDRQPARRHERARRRLVQALRDHLTDLAADLGRRTPSVLNCAGDKAFVAGADIKDMQSLGVLEARMELGQACANLLETIPKPTIAAINGYGARRRLRARSRLRRPHSVEAGKARPAGGQPRDHPGLGWEPAPAAHRRARLREGDRLPRARRRGPGGTRLGPREPDLR